MTHALGDLLPKDRFEEPPEVQIIKDFIQTTFQQPARITVQPALIVIWVRGAALAGALRPELYRLQQLCQTEKRLVIRIG
jgi:hypothetical protein